MSKPENPLASYRSYSYHHVFIACDTTVAAEDLATSDNLFSFLRQGSKERYNVRTTPKGVGNYVIISNGMTDAEFSITNLEWYSQTAAKQTSEKMDFYTTMAVEGSMKVMEPRGIRFLNVLSRVCDKLQTDPTGVVWMVKTIFVGHRSGTATEAERKDHITTIKPLMFTIYDISSTFDVTGGIYDLKFTGLNNGAAKLPQVVKAAEQVKINLSAKPSLKDALSTLQDILNKRSRAHWEKINREVTELNLPIEGRLIEYKIIAEEPYLSGQYNVTDSQPQNRPNGTDGEGITLDFSRGISIEYALQQIMSHCPQVRKDREGQTEDNKKYVYKIVSTIVSNADSYKVIYKVRRFPEAQSTLIEEIQQGKASAEIQANLIEFDYFFSGKSVDILTFDLKMEMGLVFFQTLTATNNLGNQVDSLQGQLVNAYTDRDGKPINVKVTSENTGFRKKIPVFFSTTVKNPLLHNSTDPGSAARFQSLLARHAALENLEVTMNIVGNPSLLASTIRYPSEYEKETTLQVGADETFPYWERIPALAKVNIFMPSDDTNGDFAERFWYDGLYYVVGVTHTFVGGEFTQTLDMVSLPNAELDSNLIAEQEEQRDINEQKRIKEECPVAPGGEGVTRRNPTNSDVLYTITAKNMEGCRKQ